MAKKATAKAGGGSRKSAKTAKPPARARSSSERRRSSTGGDGGTRTDPVDALIKLLQSPLVIDLLAVGATAALAAITEHRSSRTDSAAGNAKKTMKAAGTAAAAAVARRLKTEFDEIKKASREAGETRKAKADTAA